MRDVRPPDDPGEWLDRAKSSLALAHKQAPENAPSDLGAVGRYIFLPEISDYLKAIRLAIGGEIPLTNAIRLLLQDHPHNAKKFQGRRYDTVDKLGHIETVKDYSLYDGNQSCIVSGYMRERIG